MEEANNLAADGIHSSDIGTLVAIAVQAGKRQIAGYGSPSMLACNDMVDLKGSGVNLCREPTVLASVASPLAHESIEVSIQRHPET
jgi:hypothetical protein